MSDLRLITPTALETLVDGLLQDGARILSPRRRAGHVELSEVRSPTEVAADHVQSVASAKAVVFPRAEAILRYRGLGRDLELSDPQPALPATVVFGIRPCEARAFGALESIFGWDTRDVFFDARRERLTVVSIACTESDEACFCTSVGGGPDDPQGSDVLMRPLVGGGHAAEALSDKGRALLQRAGELPVVAGEQQVAPPAEVARAFDAAALREVLAGRFDDPVWVEQSLRCLGCGACAFVCPTCACFDIQDEPAHDGAGRRLRCWDSCGLRLFTLHASGHNPRERQGQRWRQRVYHKFAYLPERFGRTGCVGCGKCSRACPADMSLKEHLVALAGVSG
jgi:formate hydrogenlyase subunit 6/NADH:ubiquinone oxidoreductase subunit I